MTELFIEIFTEELPAIPLLKNLSNIKENWKKILKDNYLESHFDFFYTPRRLSFIHKDFALKQPDTKTQSYGPPLAIAYDSNNNPTKAMQSFLQKNNITKDMVKTATKDNKEVLFECVIEAKGEQLEPNDKWKENLLLDLESELVSVREKQKNAKNLRLRGLGFFSVGDKEKQVEFQNEFRKVVLGA